MLERVGIKSVDDLLTAIPKDALRPKLGLPVGMSELEVQAHLESLAAKNRNAGAGPFFLGGPVQRRYIPAAVPVLALRGEFLTAYTPYQPEVSQGTLQSIFEYQSLMCELLAMDVANSSMYEGGSAVAEAAFMAVRSTGRKRVVMASEVYFEFRRTVRTYARGPDLEIVEVPTRDLASAAEGAACLIVQHPDAFGGLVDVRRIADAAHAAGALCIQVTEPHANALLEPPGALGVDIVVGEGQPLGIPMSFGGPYLGVLACRNALVRQMPGRVVGETHDARGMRGFVNTLQTREQHIRREKATSNICTNEAIAAITAAIYLALMGPEGLSAAARLGVAKAHALAPLLVEIHEEGRAGRHVRGGEEAQIPASFARKVPLDLPELTEPQVVRHFTHLAQLNYSVDTGMYPLGSCTMKYNPKINDRVAGLFSDLHPMQPEGTVQGALALLAELESMLAKVTGMDAVTLQPAAGAQAEFTAILMFKAYHQKRGEGAKRHRVIVPDTAHGTNPASAAMCGFQVTTVKSDAHGNIDLASLKAALGDDVVGLMLTNPNTLGLFEERLREVCDAVHAVGGLVYGDGANMNALLGVARPGDLGFDCIHIHVHKTFSTPHGAGGPGAGPLCVKEPLRAFPPKPWIVRDEQGRYHLDTARDDQPPAGLGDSIGRVRTFLGNFGVLVRAYTYMRTLGEEGLAEASNDAILAANYLLAQLRDSYDVAFDRPWTHEFVLSASRQKKQGASALDVAKALIDEGFHPPTVYFPLVVPEALMIEPTETEPRETLDAFAAAMVRIAERAKTDPASVKAAPKHAPLARLDEVSAARNPKLKWQRPT